MFSTLSQLQINLLIFYALIMQIDYTKVGCHMRAEGGRATLYDSYTPAFSCAAIVLCRSSVATSSCIAFALFAAPRCRPLARGWSTS